MYTLMQIYPQPESPTYLAQLLEAVGEPTRLRILNLLEQGEFCVCELQAVLGLNEPTVSRHLERLRFAGRLFTPERVAGDLLTFGCRLADNSNPAPILTGSQL